jgi:beta-lactamase regulating signal transducer with metallopeptidase domain
MVVSIESLISAAIVATIVVPIALLVSRMVLHKSPSSARHLVWLLPLVAILIGPVLSVATSSPFSVDASSFFVNAERMQMLVEQQTQGGVESGLSPNQSLDHLDRAHVEQSFDSPLREPAQPVGTPSAAELTNPVGDHQAGNPAVPATAVADTSAEPAIAALRPWLFTAGLVWIVVAVGIVCLAVAAQGVLFVKRQGYQKITDAALLQMCCDAATELGVRREATLLEGEFNAMPMTWGVVWPVLLLPACAHEWSTERMRMVLLHELAHVRRYDVCGRPRRHWRLRVTGSIRWCGSLRGVFVPNVSERVTTLCSAAGGLRRTMPNSFLTSVLADGAEYS